MSVPCSIHLSLCVTQGTERSHSRFTTRTRLESFPNFPNFFQRPVPGSIISWLGSLNFSFTFCLCRPRPCSFCRAINPGPVVGYECTILTARIVSNDDRVALPALLSWHFCVDQARLTDRNVCVDFVSSLSEGGVRRETYATGLPR